ncbi:MAG TPA: hypothetical protein VE981_07345 [Planctomycetota bacterium]|nr:hypothetical protein [Planctomycetota bacterium]
MGLVVAAFLAVKFVLYGGLFYLLGFILDIGVPLDSLRAGFHRTWLGVGATIASLILYMVFRMAGLTPQQNRTAGSVVIWILRAAIWTAVTVHVYRVTRWRKGKLAIVVAAGLALNLAIDFGLERLQGSHPFMPSLGQWELRLC